MNVLKIKGDFMLSAKIRELRKAKNLTQKELAEKIGMSSVQIVNIEKGKTKPNATTLKKLSLGLECDYEMLFKENYKE